jgi:bifunctional ADP-heptose synthase (sugar kinase/adenylyltransferase)
MEDLRAAPLEAGTVRDFSEPNDRVLKATLGAIVQAGLTIKETSTADETGAIILAERGMSAFSWGELVRVIVQKSSERQTVVRILTMRRIAMNITAKADHSEAIFANISLALKEI